MAIRHFRAASPLLLSGLSSPPLVLHGPPLSSLLPLLAPMRVVERIVDLSGNPQAVQEHTELPRHGHHRPFLGVLASARGYLLSVAPEVRVRAEGTQDVVSAAYQKLLSILSPSLEMRFWGSLSPDWSVAGTSPRYAPTERLFSKR